MTVSSLKKENDSLKDEITALKRNLEELQQSIKRQDPQVTSNGGQQPTHLITDAESLSTLEFYGKSYNDLWAESVNSLKHLWSRLNLMSSRVGKIGDLIEQLQRYRAWIGLPNCLPVYQSFQSHWNWNFKSRHRYCPSYPYQICHFWPSTNCLQIHKKICERARKRRPIR